MSTRSVLGLFIVASLGAGCADSSSAVSPSAALAAQLEGTWTVLSIEPAGQSPQATPSSASYTLTFADGRLSTRADCNTCTGAFTLSGQTLSAGLALACTRAACSTMAFENMYISLLSGDTTVTLTRSTLLLSSPRGVVRLGR